MSLDQVGVIAGRAAEGSDEHYAELASVATVSQLRTAIKLEPRPEPESEPAPEPQVSISKSSDEQGSLLLPDHAAGLGSREVRCGVGVAS